MISKALKWQQEKGLSYVVLHLWTVDVNVQHEKEAGLRVRNEMCLTVCAM